MLVSEIITVNRHRLPPPLPESKASKMRGSIKRTPSPHAFYRKAANACALVLLSLSGLASGENTDRAREAAAGIDACSLLRPLEIARQVGFEVDAGRREDSGVLANHSYSSTCVWIIKQERVGAIDPREPLGGRSFVILNAIQWPAGSGLAGTFLQSFRDAAAQGAIAMQPVPRHFGDAALWWGDGLAVQKGDISFGISVSIAGLKQKAAGAAEEKLAARILRRLAAPTVQKQKQSP
jgi:hypothetical protein